MRAALELKAVAIGIDTSFAHHRVANNQRRTLVLLQRDVYKRQVYYRRKDSKKTKTATKNAAVFVFYSRLSYSGSISISKDVYKRQMYALPVDNKYMQQVRFLGRFDMMTDDSSGHTDENGEIEITNAARPR